MPPLPRIRSGALESLARELRFGSPAALRRQIDRAEALAARIEPERTYDERWVIEQVTGYRGAADAGVVLVGEALLADLPALVEHLCECARLSPDDAPGAITAGDLAARWRVTRRTLERYRRLGLVGRRVAEGPRARAALVFSPVAVAAFEARHAARMARAARFSRITASEADQIIERLRSAADSGASFTAAARAAAEASARSREAVRLLAGRATAPGPRPAPPLTARQREFILRATALGIAAPRVARRVGRSVASVHRIVADARARRLVATRISEPPRSHPASRQVAAHAAADEALLGSEAALHGLAVPAPETLGAFITLARQRDVPDAALERARARALVALRWRARAVIGALPASGAAVASIDRAETDLRWVSALKAALLWPLRTVVLESFESACGNRADALRAADLAPGLALAWRAASEALDRFDPKSAGRLAAPVTLAVSRAVAPWARARATSPAMGRAAPRLIDHPMVAWHSALDPWQSFLALRDAALVGELGDPHRVWLTIRHGLSGSGPRTVAEAARQIGIAPRAGAKHDREALLALRGRSLARASSEGGRSAPDQ